MNQELIIYRSYEICTLIEIMDTAMNLNDRTMAGEREILNRSLYYDMGQFKSFEYNTRYIGQIILYLMIIHKQHLSIYEA